jgi:tRNA-Thr(GGU) m(6)t(6)A37 methyltransferase TsaA
MTSSEAPLTFAVTPIGHVHTGHHEAGATPIQARLNRTGEGTVVIEERFAAGLEGLEQFDFAWLVTFLHRSAFADDSDRLRPVPFLAEDHRPVGLFATRYPARPNPIGLSLVEIASIEGRTIRFRGVDLLDGTPVLDIKPWVPDIDLPRPGVAAALADIRTGWYTQTRLTEIAHRDGETSTRIPTPTPDELGENS